MKRRENPVERKNLINANQSRETSSKRVKFRRIHALIFFMVSLIMVRFFVLQGNGTTSSGKNDQIIITRQKNDTKASSVERKIRRKKIKTSYGGLTNNDTIATLSNDEISTNNDHDTNNNTDESETKKKSSNFAGLSEINIDSDHIWSQLIQEAAALLPSTNATTTTHHHHHPPIAMEIGMHSARQCLEAARAGLESHCFEPSPHSYSRIHDVEVSAAINTDPLLKPRVRLYNMTAGRTTGTPIDFNSGGKTGDHVGDFDMWNMKKGNDNSILLPKRHKEVVTVYTVRLDDVVANITTTGGGGGGGRDDDDVFLIKVDTQGFEPSVFAGLTTAIAARKVRYVLFEYWPKGMDLLSELSVGDDDQTTNERCDLSVNLLKQFLAAGYKLYAMPVMAHPEAPVEGRKAMRTGRPMDDLRENCEFYYGLEERYPKDDYHMGYWSDMLAVSPTANITIPVTATGMLIHGVTT